LRGVPVVAVSLQFIKIPNQSKAGRHARKPIKADASYPLAVLRCRYLSDRTTQDKPLRQGGNYKGYYVKQVLTKGFQASGKQSASNKTH